MLPFRAEEKYKRSLRVALATTHLALKDVPGAITRELLHATLRIVDTDLRAKFGILNALHIPGADSTVFYRSMSSIHTFRIVLNALFGTSLPMLPDHSYVMDHERYEFVEVTEQVR